MTTKDFAIVYQKLEEAAMWAAVFELESREAIEAAKVALIREAKRCVGLS